MLWIIDQKRRNRGGKQERKDRRNPKDLAPAAVEEQEPKGPKRRNRNRDRQNPNQDGEVDAAPAPGGPKAAAKAKAEAKAKAKSEAKSKASKAVNAKKGTDRSQKAPPILVTHKTKHGKEVLLDLQNECG